MDVYEALNLKSDSGELPESFLVPVNTDGKATRIHPAKPLIVIER